MRAETSRNAPASFHGEGLASVMPIGVVPHSRKETGSMNLKPLGDRVVVEREEAKEKTAGGIVLPDTAKDKPQKGKVLAVGDGRLTKDGKRRELQVKVGDQVLFTSYAGEEFKTLGDKKVLLMREDDILAVID
jgi:chaperonin GroES